MQAFYESGRDSALLHALLADKNIGLFCRLVGKDGTDVLSPRRLVGMTTTNDWAALWNVSPFLEVTPDGVAVLFVWDWRDRQRRLSQRGRASQLLVISVEPGGRVRTESLDVEISGKATGISRERPTGRFAAAFDGRGKLHCFFGGQGDVPADHVVFRVRDADTRLLTRKSYPWGASRKGGAQPRTTQSAPLQWLWAGCEHYDVRCVSSETLLVAFAPGSIYNEDAHWGASFPGETLFTYRFHLGDLALIDSHRALAQSVSGWDYSGARLPRALLRKTGSGYKYFVPTREGTAVYELGLDGSFVLGKRAVAEFGPATSFTGPGEQVVTVKTPTGGQSLVDWFGFGESGTLYHDSASTSTLRH
jgi:hypothetical protein